MMSIDKANLNELGLTIPDGESVHILCDNDITKLYPKRKRNTHKGDYGTANIVAGSDRYPGAAALATAAALKSGCGYVKLTTTEKVKFSLAPKYPQAIYSDETDENANAISIGMGCGISEQLYRTICHLIENYKGTLVIDADGLNSLAKYGVDILQKRQCNIILTPHVKEFSRISDCSVEYILNNPIKAAIRFALEHNIVLLLKGAASIITDGTKTCINTRGTTALAKGGSGDMLAGYLAGSIARGLEPFDAVCCATYTLGLAAELSSQQKTDYCATAKDILNNLHLSVKQLTGNL